MDIHAPERPIHSLKDFAIHISIVTVGILIALGLDGLREHFREHRLVQETREQVRFEMSANHDHMARELQQVTQLRKQLQQLVDAMPALAQQHPDELIARVRVIRNPGYFFAANSWQAALSTGALAHMPTGEVAAYAYAAEGIAKYTTLQEAAESAEDHAVAAIAAHPHPTPEQVESEAEDLMLFYNAEDTLTSVGPQVQDDIERALRATAN